MPRARCCASETKGVPRGAAFPGVAKIGDTSTAVAVRYRVLWFITFTRGDADRLVETGGESEPR